jgi:hypothetical protein
VGSRHARDLRRHGLRHVTQDDAIWERGADRHSNRDHADVIAAVVGESEAVDCEKRAAGEGASRWRHAANLCGAEEGFRGFRVLGVKLVNQKMKSRC